MANGILLMVLATSMWGVSFVTPLVLYDYTPIEITLGRYVFYGIASIVLWFSVYRHTRIPISLWGYAILYAVAGNIGFSLLITYGIQEAGAEISIPIIGLLPVCIAIFGNASLSEVPWNRLLPPLGLVSIALLTVLSIESGLLEHQSRLSVLGVSSIVFVVAMWTWYAISNSVFLRRNPEISSGAWACAVGVATFALMIAWMAAQSWQNQYSYSFDRGALQGRSAIFIGITFFLGCFSSWVAALLFNKASSRLPMSLVGQLVVLETIFGIAYVCVYNAAIPPASELLGIVGIFLGIIWSINVLQKAKDEPCGEVVTLDAAPVPANSLGQQ